MPSTWHASRFMLLLTLIISTSFQVLAAGADYGVVDGIYYRFNIDETSYLYNGETLKTEYAATVYSNPDVAQDNYGSDLIVPESVKYQGVTYVVTGIALSAQENIRRIVLPKTVCSVIAPCTSLERITVDEKNPYFKADETALYSIDGDALVMFFPGAVRGDVEIKEGIKYAGPYAFGNLQEVTSLKFPSTFTITRTENFPLICATQITDGGCEKLSNYYVAENNPELTSMDGVLYKRSAPDGPLYVVDVPFARTEYTLPASADYIEGEMPFSSGKLETLNLDLLHSDVESSTIKTINTKRYTGAKFGYLCSALEQINISEEDSEFCSIDGVVYTKDKKTLYYAPQNSPVAVIPAGTERIGSSAFYYRKTPSLVLPESVVEIGDKAFSQAYVCPLVIPAKGIKGSTSLKNSFEGIKEESTLLVHKDNVATVREACKRYIYNNRFEAYPHVYSFSDMPMYVSDVRQNYGSISFSLADNPFYEGEPCKAVDVEYAQVNTSSGYSPLTPSPEGVYEITGISDQTFCNVSMRFFADEGKSMEIHEDLACFHTQQRLVRETTVSSMTTITLVNLEISTDDGEEIQSMGIEFDGARYVWGGTPIQFTSLTPNKTYHYTIWWVINGKEYTYQSSECCKQFQIKAECEVTGPSSARLTVNHSDGNGELTIKSTAWSGMGVDVEDGLATGLKPDTQYAAIFTVDTEEGYSRSVEVKFKTPALQLATLNPKGVSATCSIVSAQTNISDDETGAGFQWKKYDAPQSLVPSEGVAAVYDGNLQGYIRNLQPNVYYNVRAFYRAKSGEEYFGDWVTFDPSDFSYCDPMVHTYPIDNPEATFAYLKGYVIAGTDDIAEQGFEYWTINNPTTVRAVKAEMDEDDIMTILAAGQVMRATLTDLSPGTTYCVRSFVRTATGTYYGETQAFTTQEGYSGIYENVSDTNVTIAGYYDINGLRHDQPIHGFNIVLYSDGSTRKMFIRQ